MLTLDKHSMQPLKSH